MGQFLGSRSDPALLSRNLRVGGLLPELGDGPLSEGLYFRVVAQAVIPEPGAALLFGLALAGLAMRRRA